MTTYTLTVTAVACILGVLLLREKILRTEATEEAEVLREQFKDLRTIIENDQAEYVRAYNTLRKAGYTDNGHPLWTPPDHGRSARMMEEHRDRCVSDDWPPYGHGIETEAKAGGES